MWVRSVATPLCFMVAFAVATTGCSAPGGRTTSAPAPVGAPAEKGTAASSKAPAPPLQPATVRLGMLSSASDSGLFIAIEKGYFKEQAIEIESTPFASAAEMVAPLGAAQLDVGGGAPGAGLANAVARDIKIRIVADKGSTSPGHGYEGIVVRKDLWDSGQVTSPANFKGLKVALPNLAGISPEVELQRALEQYGSSTSDVERVAIPFPDMLSAFRGRAIDAAIPIEPFLSSIVAEGLGVVWKRADEIIPNHQVAVILFSEDFATKKPEVGRRFMVAYLKGVRDYNDAFDKKDPQKRAEVVSIIAKYTALKDPALFEKIVMPGLNPNGAVNKKTLDEDQEYYLAKRYQQQRVNFDEIVDPQFANYAVQQLGPYR